MKKLIILFAFFAIALPSFSQIRAYVKPLGIEGESVDIDHPKWIEALATAGGECTEITFGGPSGGTASRPTVKEFTFSFNLDKATNLLRKKLYEGVPITNMNIEYVRQGGGNNLVFYKIYMEDVFVTSVDNGWSEGSLPIVNVSFKPIKFRYSYYPLTPQGNLGPAVIFGWNLQTNTMW